MPLFDGTLVPAGGENKENKNLKAVLVVDAAAVVGKAVFFPIGKDLPTWIGIYLA